MSAFPTFARAMGAALRLGSAIIGRTAVVRRRRLRWTIWIVSPLVLLLAAAHLVLSLAAGNELRLTVQTLRENGVPLDVSAVIPPPVAEIEDAGPLLERAFVGMTDPAAPYVPGAESGKSLPQFVDAEFLLKIPRDRRTVAQREALHRFLASEECARVLELVHAAAARPHCRFALDFGLGAGIRLPQPAKLLAVSRLVVARAEDGGDPVAACSDALALGAFSREQPFLTSQLVASSIDGRALRLLRTGIGSAAVMVDAVIALAPRLDVARNDIDGLVASLDCERILFGRLFDGGKIEEDDSAGVSERTIQSLFGSFVGYPLRAHDHASYLRIMAAARQRIAHGAGQGAPLEDARRHLLTPLTNMLLPALGMVEANIQRHRVAVDLARAALAAMRCRAESGVYPARLEDLVPRWLDEIPRQPATGEPLAFAHEADGGCRIVATAYVHRHGHEDAEATWRLPP